MENIIAHSMEKLYKEFEAADQLFLDSGIKDLGSYERQLLEAAKRAVAEHMGAFCSDLD